MLSFSHKQSRTCNAFELYRTELENWFLDEPESMREKSNWMLVVYIWRTGQSVIKARRFPLPGVAVAVDTPVITGAKAVSRGRLLKFSSLLLLAGSIDCL